jgi:hypothetical protein
MLCVTRRADRARCMHRRLHAGHELATIAQMERGVPLAPPVIFHHDGRNSPCVFCIPLTMQQSNEKARRESLFILTRIGEALREVTDRSAGVEQPPDMQRLLAELERRGAGSSNRKPCKRFDRAL